ncbi:MAG: hypothetical protein J3R72DRAFT_21762 [Linnemannia gamsii]|nr:MAG: hypothetical protein J3R72DRAFT_21762 [Linnemannia gamsii]
MSKRGQSQSPEGSRGRLKQRQHLTTSTCKTSATAFADTPKSIPPLRQTRSTPAPIVLAPKANVTTGTKSTTPSRQTRSKAVSIVTAPKENITITGKRSATSTGIASRTTFRSAKHVSNSEIESSDNSEDERDATQAIVVAISDGDDGGNDDNDDRSDASCEDSKFKFRPISSKTLPGRDQYQRLVEVLVFTPLAAMTTNSILLQSTLKDDLQAALDDIRAKEMKIVHDLQIETAHLSVSTKNAYKVVMTEYKGS